MHGPPKGQEPKRRRGHLRVAAIMQAGAELFAEKGFEGATMTEIASRSGTAIASLYRFFPTKESLAEALVRQYATHALEGLGVLATRAEALSPQALADAFVDYSLAMQEERSFAVDLIQVGAASAERRQRFRKAMREALAAIVTGVLPSLSPARAQHMAAILMTVFKGLGVVSRERPAVRRALIAETKTMVGLYLAAAAKPGG